jgi:hypothetical protein
MKRGTRGFGPDDAERQKQKEHRKKKIVANAIFGNCSLWRSREVS